VGRLAAFVSVLLAGALAGTVLSGFHARFLGVSFDAFRMIFTGTGLLAIAGGLYTRVHLASAMRLPQGREGGTPGGEGTLLLGAEVEE
jgi:hypothetical protein